VHAEQHCPFDGVRARVVVRDRALADLNALHARLCHDAAMLDLAITGGLVVDGTGAPPQRADVGVREGRVVAVGELDESARVTRDADGLARGGRR